MREFEQNFPDWRQQVESAVFGKGDIGGGTEFTVLTRPGIDIVVKIPKDPRWMQGYRIAEEKAPDLAIPFTEAANLRLNISGAKKVVPEAIVQLKVPDIVKALHNPNHFSRLLRGLVKIDKELFQRGVFIPDPKFDNFGEDRDGTIKCLDFSGGQEFPSDELSYAVLVYARGSMHYSNFLILRRFFDNVPQVFSIGKPSETYAHAIGMPAQLHPAAMIDEALMETEKNWNPDLALYFSQIGEEEFTRVHGKSPFRINGEFIRRLPDYLKMIKNHQPKLPI